ncbi:MAG: GrpB family protein [Patescibacteria group bacterium]
MKNVKIIGLRNKKVKLSPYNSAWKELYKKEEKLLHPIVEKYVLNIQHIGSTSIPGAKAKPIIDIAMGVKNLKDGEKFIKPLELLGYNYKHNAGIKGRHFFTKGNKAETTHHMHIVKLGGKLWKNQIVFRDYLLKHKEAVREYNKLKEGLVEKYKNNREKYTVQKDKFIKGILKIPQ